MYIPHAQRQTLTTLLVPPEGSLQEERDKVVQILLVKLTELEQYTEIIECHYRMSNAARHVQWTLFFLYAMDRAVEGMGHNSICLPEEFKLGY